MIRLYDNGGKSYDRYTALDTRIPEYQAGTFYAVGFNENPFSPLGFGQHCNAMPGRHLGIRIEPETLPERARQFYAAFVQECEEVSR